MNRAGKRRQKKLSKKAARNTKPVQSASSSPEQKTLTIQQAIERALQHQFAGRLPEAEGIYREILQVDPNQPVALHLLGVIAHQKGKNDVAADLITKALAIKPDYAEAHSNLGIVLRDLGKLDEAVASYHKALAIKPDDAEVHSNLGNALRDPGQRDAEHVGSGLLVWARPGGATDCSCLARTHNPLRVHDVDLEARHVFDLLASGLGTMLRPAGAGQSRRLVFHGFRSPLANSTRGYRPRPRRGRIAEVFYRAKWLLLSWCLCVLVAKSI